MTYTGRYPRLTAADRQSRKRNPRSHYVLRALVSADREPPDPAIAALRLERPRTRGECGDQRPCPWASCRHHLALDVNPESGTIKINFPDREPWELTETCSLDVADRGGAILEELGEFLNLTRERVRQIEARALRKLRGRAL